MKWYYTYGRIENKEKRFIQNYKFGKGYARVNNIIGKRIIECINEYQKLVIVFNVINIFKIN